MSARLLRPLFSDPVARLTLAMTALFCGFGAALPFLPRWLEEERGLTGWEIGAVVSGAQLGRVVIGPVIAAWADGFADRRSAMRVLAVVGLALYVVFFQAHGFLALFALSFLAASTIQALTPLIEGAALRASQTGAFPFGVARAIGSAGFVLGNVAGGALVAANGPGMVAVWLLCSLSAVAVIALGALKPDAAPATAAGLGYRGRLRLGWKLAIAPRFARVLFGAGFIQAAHAFFYSFSSLVWRDQGLSDAMTGVLWAFAVGVEIVFLLALPLIERRFQPEALLVWGGAAAVVRWMLMALAPPVFALWPLQALHALSFAAVHVAALRLVLREAPEEVMGLAQTLYAALASGLLIGLATILSGFLYDAFGAGGYWAMAALAAFGVWLAAPLNAR